MRFLYAFRRYLIIAISIVVVIALIPWGVLVWLYEGLEDFR